MKFTGFVPDTDMLSNLKQKLNIEPKTSQQQNDNRNKRVGSKSEDDIQMGGSFRSFSKKKESTGSQNDMGWMGGSFRSFSKKKESTGGQNDMLSGLKQKLNVTTEPKPRRQRNKSFNSRSEDSLVTEEEEEKIQADQLNTLAINSLILDKKEFKDDDIKVCCPKSLIAWQKRHKYKPSKAFSECTVNIPEPPSSSQKYEYYKALNRL